MNGVPQGSVLGPMLFLLYINDIINCLEDPNDAELVLYADDTNIFVISNDRSSAVTKANNVLNNINNFMKSNLLQVFVKLGFEIAVDQQTRTGDQTFEGSRTPTTNRCPRGSHPHIWSKSGPI